MSGIEESNKLYKRAHYRIRPSTHSVNRSSKDVSAIQNSNHGGLKKKESSIKNNKYVPHEDDDGYDKWSDRVDEEEFFQKDPWK